jgi:sodium transport system ATP-binding protein
LIKIDKLTKKYKSSEQKAVDSISFNVAEGESVALLGENGAGKTTAIRMISTILKPDSGNCRVNSFSIFDEPENVRKNIGILLGGETGLYARLTARENIEYFGYLHGLNPERIKERICHFSNILNMNHFLERKCQTFSKGMKQKTAIVRSLIHDPPVIILDEPTSGLDITSARTVQNLVLKLKKENKSILFSSHNMREVIRIADRIIIMHKGRIIDSGTPADLESQYEMDIEEIFHNLTGEV